MKEYARATAEKFPGRTNGKTRPKSRTRGATRILLKGELENGEKCDVILMTYFW